MPTAEYNSDCSSLTDEGFAEQMFKPLEPKTSFNKYKTDRALDVEIKDS